MLEYSLTNSERNEKMNQNRLLVLGNGFDLACGLNSTYADFFAWRFKKILEENNYAISDPENNADIFSLTRELYKSNTKNLEKFATNPNLTPWNFWDIIFLSQNASDSPLMADSNWCDIESTIKKAVTAILFNKGDNAYNEERIDKYLISPVDQLINTLRLYPDKAHLATFLLSELNKFEKVFSTYIKQEKDNKDYQARVNEVLKELLTPPFLLEASHQKKAMKHKNSILSFNYSLSNDDDFINDVSIDRWINIHGYVGSKGNMDASLPIFGIDSTDIDENDPRIIFTKTFRVANGVVNYVQPLPKQVDSISFYGHSLSQADYSYFESLFDTYHIYSSDVSLYFYFGAFANSDDPEEDKRNTSMNNELRREMTTNVYNLLAHYGKSLKENHGNNLFHRLLLENRIHIIERKGDRK